MTSPEQRWSRPLLSLPGLGERNPTQPAYWGLAQTQ